MSVMQVRIVSLEKEIFCGEASMIMLSSVEGELGVCPGHEPLLAQIKTGPVRVKQGDEQQQVFFISGGYVEVQPKEVIVLADVAERAGDLDEAQATEMIERARKELAAGGEVDYAKTLAELADASARIAAIREMRGRDKR